MCSECIRLRRACPVHGGQVQYQLRQTPKREVNRNSAGYRFGYHVLGPVFTVAATVAVTLLVIAWLP